MAEPFAVLSERIRTKTATIGIIGLVSDQAIRFLHRRWFRYLG